MGSTPRLTWTMRTKPRSAIRTVEWLSAFVATCEGRDRSASAKTGSGA